MNFFINTTSACRIHADKLSDAKNEFLFTPISCDRYYTHTPTLKYTYMLEDYEWIYVISGSFSITYDDQKVTVLPGNLLLLQPYKMLTVQTEDPAISNYLFIHFRAVPQHRFDCFLKQFTTHSSVLIRTHTPSKIEKLIFEAFAETRREDNGYMQLVASILNMLFIYFFRTDPQINLNKTDNNTSIIGNAESIVYKATDYIAENITQAPRISQISQMLGISENYLYKSFKKVLGISPIQYIQEMKIRYASELFRSGQYNITEISQYMGFSSINHFSGSFKKIMGISPFTYIKMLHSEPENPFPLNR